MADATLSVGVDSSQANQSLSKLEKQFDKLTGSIGQSMRRIDRMQKQFQNVIPQKTQQQLAKAKQQIDAVSKSLHQATTAVEKKTKAISFLSRQMATARTSLGNFGREIKKSASTLKQTQMVTLGWGSAIQALGVSLAGLSVAGLGKLIDQYIDVTNRTRLVIKDTKDLDSTMQSLYQMAQRTRTGLYDLGTLYSRLARNSRELGYNQKQMLTITENVARSMIISGASALEARNAIIQLSQAFASGKLQGDELRSVLELAPRLAQAMAKGMKVSVGSLRRLSKAGILDIKMVGKDCACGFSGD